MIKYENPSGYIRYDNEDDLKEQLESMFFPTFFDIGWKPTMLRTKEVPPSEKSFRRIDYYGTCNKKSTWVEVKNWWVTKNDIRQIYRYNRILMLRPPYDFFVICGGIEKPRRLFLEGLGIKIILTRDIKELNPKELVHWM